MDSDDDMLDDMLDELEDDLDDMLDTQLEEEEEKRKDNLLMLQITDPLELRACNCLGNMKEWKEWDGVIKKDMLKQQGLGRKKPFSRAYCHGMSPKQRAQHHIVQNKRIGLFELDKTFESLLTNALIHSKVCKDEVSANSLLEQLYNDPKTEKYSKKIAGGYRFRLNNLIKERLNGDSDFVEKDFPNATKQFFSK
jgi:hypothetical protein